MARPPRHFQQLVLQDAKFDCVKLAAPYLQQAQAEDCLPEFFDAVRSIYLDRWPDDHGVENVRLVSPSPLALLTRKQLQLSVVMAAISCDRVPQIHWKVVLSLDYDRLHRPTLHEVARARGLGRYKWPTTTAELTAIINNRPVGGETAKNDQNHYADSELVDGDGTPMDEDDINPFKNLFDSPDMPTEFVPAATRAHQANELSKGQAKGRK
ncbi:hypothetical protein CVT26_004732 [Gymnopilus dilepis]|uniref:Uncharacterized protein n=1 Tax=Gymnopilus dilepis TaxID=231916 RepID=A0A409WJM2_9AGAR|nr:hypothetical protein CVT26_004732 [Gymnopilus dilepis]